MADSESISSSPRPQASVMSLNCDRYHGNQGESLSRFIFRASHELGLRMTAGQMSAPEAISLLGGRLDSTALSWFMSRWTNFARCPWTSVDNFFNEMRCEFAPLNSEYDILERVSNLRSTGDLNAHAAIFNELTCQLVTCPEYVKILFWIKSLDPTTAREVRSRAPRTLTDAIRLSNSLDLGDPSTEMSAVKTSRRPMCTHCKKPGHLKETCWVLHPDMKPPKKE